MKKIDKGDSAKCKVGIPHFLYEKLKMQYSIEEVSKILAGYCENRKTTFRVNTLKSNTEEIESVLKNHSISYQRVDWYDEAYILENENEIDIRNLSIYEEGKIYLQSLSSMLPAILMEPQQGENILDMAAAPGGKTTQMATISRNTALITACEKNKIRAERLKYNI